MPQSKFVLDLSSHQQHTATATASGKVVSGFASDPRHVVSSLYAVTYRRRETGTFRLLTFR